MKSADLKRVLFVHDGPLYRDENANFYGVHYTDNIRKRYLQLGESVTFLMRVNSIMGKDASGLSSIGDDNFRVIEVPNFKSTRLFLKNYSIAKKIIHQAVSNHDIIVVRMPSAIAEIALLYAHKISKPILAEFVGCTFDAYWNYSWKGKLIAHYKMWVQKQLVKKVPYIIYVTKRFLQSRYPSHAQQIHCSNVEIECLNLVDLERKKSRLMNLDSDRPLVIGTVAAIDVPYKGQSDVIKAVAILKDRGVKVEYKIVGQGDRARLTTLINKLNLVDSVKILGALKHADVFEFLDSLDLYIQPSKQEGLPRALIEAMSKACPCLGSNIAGIPELLDDEYIFEPGNPNAIVKKIMNISKERLIEQSSLNFHRSEDYLKDVLDARRMQFFSLFLKEIGQ